MASDKLPVPNRGRIVFYRTQPLDDVRRRVADGGLYEFLYAEPATTPIPLNERHHLPNHPLIDYGFHQALSRVAEPAVRPA